MDDDTEIERMLEEKMEEDVQKKQQQEQTINKNGDKKVKDKDKDKDKDKKHKKHKHHKHHKSHKSDKKHERKRSRSPNERRRRTPTPPTLPSGKRRDVNSELHQLAQTLNRNRHSKENLAAAASKSNRREKSPELTPEERDLRTVFCKKNIFKIKNLNLYL
jgi:hypothetical protein